MNSREDDDYQGRLQRVVDDVVDLIGAWTCGFMQERLSARDASAEVHSGGNPSSLRWSYPTLPTATGT